MPLTLEQRMEAIENKVAALADGLTKASPRKKDWHATFGLSKDDPEFEEMIRLGEAYRRSRESADDRAHS